ncbi:uncharacterized protein LOC128394581 [Panonychus citri]|uniref:uncharacterized protein LOC128394581 n=1 Tax=Panonychus citri TaxID=50023 RepID=UPI002307C6AD|nr:uncharacterized protein LOC128394581 [Panonychus citri]
MRYDLFQMPVADWISKPETVTYRTVGTKLGRSELCNEFYLNYNECMEAYGRTRGFAPCEPFRTDFFECKNATKAILRHRRVRVERIRQVLEGERKMKDFWGRRPESDSFIPEPFW